MYEGTARSRAETEDFRSRARSRIIRNPDRIAFWAFGMAVVAMIAAAASAHAGSGGTALTSSCKSTQFGDRTLRLGDCGTDVKTLNWILKAQSYSVPLHKSFKSPTHDSVTSFQRRHSLRADGVVRSRTRRKIVRSMHRDVATWYGPGFFGSRTACGQRLQRDTVGVANRTLPCGTKVVIGYKGRYLRTTVIDRGPYSNGANWDLTERAAKKLGFTQTDKVRSAAIK